ncbi:MAG: hypothetical protein C0506_13565 [Anaerolinea sp.]|nr:hypothetical protein [Anaerolinea sp.]
MLVFLDESGDAGLAIEKGSSPYFTVAAVFVADDQAARMCLDRITRLRLRLRMRPYEEFHFRADSHDRRLQVLDELQKCDLQASTCTLGKAALVTSDLGLSSRDDVYLAICLEALKGHAGSLQNARVIMDEFGGRKFQRTLSAHLKLHLNTSASPAVRSLTSSRSRSDPMVQVADYFAAVVNRAESGTKTQADYLARVASKITSRVRLP